MDVVLVGWVERIAKVNSIIPIPPYLSNRRVSEDDQ